MDDNNLIKKCQQGEKEAFQLLISKYHPLVYKFLLKLTQNKELAEDLTQETFLKLIRNIEKYDIYGKAKFSTYIITVAKNCYIDEIRKSRRISLDYNLEDYANKLPDESKMEEAVVNRMYASEVEGRLEDLTEEQKLAIRLKYIEGLTLKEIGEILNVETTTVKSRIHNGIIRLRKFFER